MKNRAALLALIVLAIATLLMIFVISPRLSDNGADNGESPQQAADKAADAAGQASEKAGEAAPQAVAQLKEKATATLEKMDRLTGTSKEALGALTALFDGSRLPSGEAFAEARRKAETALTDLSAVELPEGIGGDVLAKAQKLREDAARAIEWLKTLPEDPQAAASVIGRVRYLFPLAFEEESAGAEEPNAQAAAPDEAAAVAALPTFDVLRVEPDGSTVIAGRAAPGVTIEIVSGEDVLTEAVTGPGGEFAAILDDPLPPGDHQLALRATDADGAIALSGEVATVSVPKDKDGQLLAMISTPGQASRLLAIPSTSGETPPPAPSPGGNGSAAVPNAAAPNATGSAPPPAAGVPVRVSAVEIEDDRIFVAGAATAGATIRAFVGNTPIGEVTVDPTGHFVVEGSVPLAPGDYIIAVEMLGKAGNVVTKVTVPFNRPAGSQVAAVAADQPAESTVAQAESPDTKALGRLTEDVARAFGLLQSLYADGKVPDREELAAARSATEFSLRALSEFVPDAQAPDTVRSRSAEVSSSAARALSTLSDLPRDAADLGRALPDLSGQIGTVTEPGPEPEVSAAAPTALSQAPLTPSDDAVIIRRGDTLWQISRRVYGQGVRYTTIYLANRNEIRNPDLIEPGQVFTVPREALPNAEELHRRRMSGEPLQ